MSKLHGRNIGLGLVFLLFFSLPLIIGFWLFRGGARNGSIREDPSLTFSHPVRITEDREFLRIKHSEQLNPEKGKDFLFTGWFRPRRLPRERDRITLFSKYSPDAPKGPGYVVALLGEATGVRIGVYWRNSRGDGQFYSFEEFPLVTDEWFMVGVSYINGRYLGVHTITRVPGHKPQVQLGGGYDLGEEGIFPDADADLILGSVRAGQFRGEIGPFGVAKKNELGPNLKEIFRDLSRTPNSLPSFLSLKNMKLWAPTGIIDESPTKYSIEREGFPAP